VPALLAAPSPVPAFRCSREAETIATLGDGLDAHTA
jgi:hypothetical protein